MQYLNILITEVLKHPYLTIIIIFMIVKCKDVIEALSSYDKEQKKMIVSSRKVIAFMSASSLFHQINYCMTHKGMNTFNVNAGWTEAGMTLILLGLVTIPEIGNLVNTVKNVIPSSTNVKETKETKETKEVVNG